MDQIIQGKSCATNKIKSKIADMVLYVYFKVTCQKISETIRKTEVTKNKVDKDGKKTSATLPREHSVTTFCMAIDRLKDHFFQKIAVQREKAYMRIRLH